MNEAQLGRKVAEVLDAQPTEEGRIAIVLATLGPPPAVARYRPATFTWRMAGRGLAFMLELALDRLGGAFTLLVPLGQIAARVEASPTTALRSAPLRLSRAKSAICRLRA